MAKTPAPPAAGPKPAKQPGNLLPRINFALTPDESAIAVDALQPKTRDRLRRILADPELFGKLGLDRPAGAAQAAPGSPAAEADRMLTAGLVGMALQLLGKAAVAIAVRRGATPDAARMLELNADDVAEMTPPYVVLVDDLMPAGLGKYEKYILAGAVTAKVYGPKLARFQDASAPPAAAPTANIVDFPKQTGTDPKP